MELTPTSEQDSAFGITQDTIIEIGLRLKQKRENNLNQSIEEISNKIKINEHYIRSIENGEWDKLPNVTIGRRFVKLYAKELNCNIEELEETSDSETHFEPAPQKDNLSKMVEYARLKSMRNTSHLFGLFSKPSGTKLDIQKPAIKTKEALKIVSESIPMKEEDFTPKKRSVPKINLNILKILNFINKKWLIGGSISLLTVGLTVSGVIFFIQQEDKSVPQWESVEPNSNNNSSIAGQKNPSTDTLQIETPEPVTIAQESTENTESVKTVQETTVTPKVSPQNMHITVLSPVNIYLKADGKEMLNGITAPKSFDIEFNQQAELIIEDSSKVKLSFAGWEEEQLSPVKRKRKIVLNANAFKEF